MMRTALLLLAVAMMVVGTTVAFTATKSSRPATVQSVLNMAPRFDKDTARWIPSSPEEEASAGYDAIGSLLRQGPGPFFQRIFKPDDYDQAVLKYMAGEKCSRDEAQANMDAFLRNPSDWQYNRMEEQKLGTKVDYLTLKTDQIALTAIWSTIVISGVSRLAYSLVNHVNFWAFLPWASR